MVNAFGANFARTSCGKSLEMHSTQSLGLNMPKANDDLSDQVELMSRVASHYYLDQLTQGEIAKSLNISRAYLGTPVIAFAGPNTIWIIQVRESLFRAFIS